MILPSRPNTGANRRLIAFEPGVDAGAAAHADLIRKFGDFVHSARAAMSARLHAVLDALLGQGRVLLQEMALVKPPLISGEKAWHQDRRSAIRRSVQLRADPVAASGADGLG